MSSTPPAKPGAAKAASPAQGQVQAPVSEVGSELPDAGKLAISRAANPTLEVRERAAVKLEASAERPVSVNVSLGDGGSRPVGDVVVVRLSANVDSYFVVMRVDATGKATTVFQSSRPAQRLACVVKAGPEPGAEYLVAVASTRSLNSEDVTAALRGMGSGFTTMPAGAEAGSQPGQAWSAILAHAGNVGGSPTPARWQRHEWDVATTSFVTVPKSEKPAEDGEVKAAAAAPRSPSARSPVARGLAAKVAGPKVPVAKPAPARKPADTGEGSTLPDGKPGEDAPAPDKNPEKPAESPQSESSSPSAPGSPGGE